MTKFADMPKGSLNGWLAWCGSHDWGQGDTFGESPAAWYDGMTGEIVTYEQFADGFKIRVVEHRHKTPADLKAWAGY